MKKNYFFTILTLFFTFFISNAQLLDEDFSAGVPANGWTIDAEQANWSQVTTENAGGTAPEARLNWNPQFDGTSRFISPAMDLTGIPDIILSFKHAINHYDGPYTVGVATRSNGGAWTSVWSMDGADIVEEQTLLINNSDTNQANFEFCFYFTGNSYNMNYWYIDDVKVLEVSNLNMAINSVDTPLFAVVGNVDIKGTMANYGITTITSFDATYQIDNDAPVTETFSGLNLNITNVYNFTFSTPWSAYAGNHNVEIFIHNINGIGDDDNMMDNVLNKSISIATQTTTNFPLFEEFTSSTCAPCASFNSSAMNPFMINHPNDIAVVKYQMSWPSPGDPYYTDEGGVRRGFYQVTSVPSIFIGGTQYSATAAGLTNGLNTENAKGAMMDVNADFTMNGSNITVNVDVLPYLTGDFQVHIAVIEKETTQNVGNNGETSFEHVMMKMLPDANGTNAGFVSGTNFTFSESFDMSTTNVEELNDLAVVVFVQHNATKTIMQSKYLPVRANAGLEDVFLNAVSVYPNPSKGVISIESNENLTINITDITGRKVVENTTIIHSGSIDLSKLNNGVYFVNIDNGQTKGTKKIVLNK